MTPFDEEKLRDELLPSLAHSFTTLRVVENDWLTLLPYCDRTDLSPREREILMLGIRRMVKDAKRAIEDAAEALGTSFTVEDIYPGSGSESGS